MSVNTKGLPSDGDNYKTDAWAQEYAIASLVRKNNIEKLAQKDVEENAQKLNSIRNPYKAANLVNSTAQKRHQELTADYPELKKENYASEEEYKQALINQYGKLKQQRYEYTCYNEGAKAYNFTREVTKDTSCGGTKAMNAEIWSGCERYLSKHPDMKEQFNDSCYARVVPSVTNTLQNTKSTTMNCCAVSSKSLVSKISAEMGYDGKDNFVTPQHGSKAYLHRAANGIINDAEYKDYKEQGNLWDLIDKGKIGPGDMYCIRTSQNATNTTTGYHAKTVVAVERDANGKLISYTTHGNNNTDFSVVTARTNTVVNAVSTNKWMAGKIKEEQQKMQQMDVAEIKAMVADEKQKTNGVIDNLRSTESNLFNGKNNIKAITKIEQRYVAAASTAQKQQAMEEYRRSPNYQQDVVAAKVKYNIMSYDNIQAEAQKRLAQPYTRNDVKAEEIRNVINDKGGQGITAASYQGLMSYELKMSAPAIQEISRQISGNEVNVVQPQTMTAEAAPKPVETPKQAVVAEMKDNAQNAQNLAERRVQEMQQPTRTAQKTNKSPGYTFQNVQAAPTQTPTAKPAPKTQENNSNVQSVSLANLVQAAKQRQ